MLKSTIEIVRRVISTEADGLIKLSAALPVDVEPLIEAILKTRGRVIVSGVGKSGHICRKIAATLASTGTPAYFVHATEASHGDLGMVTPEDLCLVISNSGETTELKDLVSHTRRFKIPLAVISSKASSSLIKAADFKLLLPATVEACSLGMVPTTSTTLSLALGDALAVALMESRNFKTEEFSVFHPGGKLGAQLLSVNDLMHSGEMLPLVDFSSGMREALITMTSKMFGVAIVTNRGAVAGVITDGDLRRHMDELLSLTAGEVASKSPICVLPSILAVEALNLMISHKINVLLVVNNENTPIGILGIHDLLRVGLT